MENTKCEKSGPRGFAAPCGLQGRQDDARGVLPGAVRAAEERALALHENLGAAHTVPAAGAIHKSGQALQETP